MFHENWLELPQSIVCDLLFHLNSHTFVREYSKPSFFPSLIIPFQIRQRKNICIIGNLTLRIPRVLEQHWIPKGGGEATPCYLIPPLT